MTTATIAPSPIETPQAAYTAAVLAVRELGRALGAAVDVQYETPPGFRAVPNRDGVLNPTLDLVTDPRRVELSRAISASRIGLTDFVSRARLLTEDLDTALSRWAGEAA